MTRDERAIYDAAFGCAYVIRLLDLASADRSCARLAAEAVFLHRDIRVGAMPTDEQVEELYQESRGEHG